VRVVPRLGKPFLMIFVRSDEALLQYSQLTTLPKANKSNVAVLNRVVKLASRGHPLEEHGSNTWSSSLEDDWYSKSLMRQLIHLLFNFIWEPKVSGT